MNVKRTSLLLDRDLLGKAAAVLGTEKTTDTVRASLERTVRQAHLANLIAWELPDSAYENLTRQRRERDFG